MTRLYPTLVVQLSLQNIYENSKVEAKTCFGPKLKKITNIHISGQYKMTRKYYSYLHMKQ